MRSIHSWSRRRSVMFWWRTCGSRVPSSPAPSGPAAAHPCSRRHRCRSRRPGGAHGTAPSMQLLFGSHSDPPAAGTRGRHARARAGVRVGGPHARRHGAAASPGGGRGARGGRAEGGAARREGRAEFDSRMAYGMPSTGTPLCISAAMSPSPFSMLHLGWKAAPRRLWHRRPARP